MARARDYEDEKGQAQTNAGLAKDYNQVESLQMTMDALKAKNRELETELLNLYRRVYSQDRPY